MVDRNFGPRGRSASRLILGPRSPVGRFILDLERVPNPGSEAATAVSCFERVAPLVPGAQAIVYDTALRGVHHQKILREMGIVPVNKVAALETSHSKTTKRKIRRREKTVHVGDKTIRRPDGTTTAIKLFSRAGAIGIMRPTEAGALKFEPFVRKRTHRMQADNGLYRWYNDYRLPEHLGGGQITVRLHQSEEDKRRKVQPHGGCPAHPAVGSRLPSPLRSPQRLRITNPRTGGHFVPRTRSQPWLAPSAGRDDRLGLMVNALTVARHRSADGLLEAA